ncbi:hypothetical protein E6O75_ATG06168 [Venturia nashicola]|uniref:Zn(2)-C6 fungal-type domain-containing protein n=1 Tax=Venturia nashicola TaxID=86259 RepID=A0A4Z1NWQ2_9PEZI|nr:hypothetical protein E6O75_ATG06168 [Venturia nashicola]
MDVDSNSASPPMSAEGLNSKNHTRTYQACGPCRERKVKCEMGPVDNPHEPPCARCRREKKNCVFSSTRRKRHRGNTDDGSVEDSEAGHISSVNGNGKRSRALTAERTFNFASPHGSRLARALTPGGGIGNPRPLQRPMVKHEDPEAEGHSFHIIKNSEVFGSTDGIGTLIDAAATMEERGRHSRTTSLTTPRPNMASMQNGNDHGRGHMRQPSKRVDPDLTTDPALKDIDAMTVLTNTWNRLRFVRAGYFTPVEGMQYVEYFYDNFASLTAVTLPNYRDPIQQVALLEQEPMLLITILTITSRYVKLRGHGGSVSRPTFIHEKMWAYLKSMVDRTVWAQEQFGGGFCGAGVEEARRIDPTSQQGLRTIGTVEALLLLTEWNPRALHFPPGDDDDSMLVPENPQHSMDGSSQTLVLNGTGGQRRDSWLEPIWRSDRMSWMLTNMALSLAFEIGIFETQSQEDLLKENPAMPPATVQAYFARKAYLKELLWVHYVQTSGRLEFIGKLPDGFLNSFHRATADQRVQNEVDRRLSRIEQDPNISFAPMGHFKEYERQDPQTVTLFFWQEIAAIMKAGNQTMFLNRSQTRDVISTGTYRKLLPIYQPLLLDWRHEFDRCQLIAEPVRLVLLVEYEYSRIYLHSLALHAIIQRCVSNTPVNRNVQPVAPDNNGRATSEASSSKSNGGAIAPGIVRKWMGADAPFIAEVIDGCRNILEIVKTLAAKGHLKHCPVRTYFRIIAGACFLLKCPDDILQTLALGDYAGEVQKSINLLREAADAMRNSVVDDVHIGLRFAEACDTVTRRVESNFVRVAAGQGATAGASRAHSQSPAVGGSPRMGTPNGVQMPPTTAHPANNAHWSNDYSGLTSMPQDGAFSMGYNGNGHNAFSLNGADAYDPNTMTIMPPPEFPYPYDGTFGNHNPGFNGIQLGTADNAAYMNDQDWLAIDLTPLAQVSSGAEVVATHLGPEVNGFDMLDQLLLQGETSHTDRF